MVNVPLNPELPAPVTLLELVTLVTLTFEPTERPCGSSVV